MKFVAATVRGVPRNAVAAASSVRSAMQRFQADRQRNV